MTALVIVASTRAAAGVYEDRSGPILVSWLRAKDFDTPDPVIVADADLPAFLDELKFPQVVLISGGTGLTRRQYHLSHDQQALAQERLDYSHTGTD